MVHTEYRVHIVAHSGKLSVSNSKLYSGVMTISISIMVFEEDFWNELLDETIE